MEITTTQVRDYCNILAMQRGLDPAGNAGEFDDALILETPLPWKQELYARAGALPQEVIDLLALWRERYEQGLPFRHRPLAIAPDPEYAVPGHRRVLYYTRPTGTFARFDKREYVVPNAEVGPLIWALYEAPDDLPRFDAYQVPGETRDLLVCTHGTIDAACAKFGFPLYQTLRQNFTSAGLRVWRVSHFGGHVFAPTVLELPTGHYWAYIEADQAAQIATRSQPVGGLRGHYRGWTGVEYGFVQAAEREAWQQVGWDWFDYHKRGRILEQDSAEEPQWAEVEIEYHSADGRASGSYRMRLDIHHHIETITTTGKDHTHAYPQYVVSQIEHSA